MLVSRSSSETISYASVGLRSRWICLTVLVMHSLVCFSSTYGLDVRVNREEVIDLKIPRFNNGASPGWNNGSPMIVRRGEDVWFSLSRPVEGALPYVNTKWQIHKRKPDGWDIILQAEGAVEREPAPLALMGPSTLVVYVNPKTSLRAYREENEAYLWNSHPHLLSFPVDVKRPDPLAIEPLFSPEARFREHTYRGIAVNPPTKEILLVHQDPDTEKYYPSYLDPEGNWHALDELKFPIRSLYANLHIRNGEAHVFAVGDIPEPVVDWRAAKFEVLKRRWDYAFRVLNYTWTPDAKDGFLQTHLTIEDIDDRPGITRNLDLLVEEDGTAHLLYIKRRFQYAFLRDKFFPDESLSVEIGYAQIRKGELLAKHPIASGLAETDSADLEFLDLSYGRLHRLENGQLIAIYSYEDNTSIGMRVVALSEDGKPEQIVEVPLKHPMRASYFTNTERGGSAPSNKIDLLELGWGDEFHTVRYAEIEVMP